jgi:hypothetical protein
MVVIKVVVEYYIPCYIFFELYFSICCRIQKRRVLKIAGDDVKYFQLRQRQQYYNYHIIDCQIKLYLFTSYHAVG